MAVFILDTTGKELLPTGDAYRFRGASGEVSWPKLDGVGLTFGGVWNFLFRLGIRAKVISTSDKARVDNSDILFVGADRLDESIKDYMSAWLSNGGRVVASGLAEAWSAWLGEEWEVARSPYPYAALAYTGFNGHAEIMAPPLWSYLRSVKPNDADNVIGSLVAVRGERQTPSRALISPLDNAAAIIKKGRFYYLNASPFAAFQAWLQGQENLLPWLHWRHRMFWLDELAACLWQFLVQVGALPADMPKQFVPGLAETTVVLRHDLDASRDTAYMMAEDDQGIPGVHAILKDLNTDYWVDRLRKNPMHESAFHFNTAIHNTLLDRVKRKLKLPVVPYRPSRTDVVGKGLLGQVKWAKRRDIGVQTLHRHLAFILYPEMIDALDHVYQHEPEVLGSSSMFRGQVLRWGVDRVDDVAGTLGSFPDSQFPLWFPYKQAHAADGGRLLRGWESTSIMEIDPEMFEQMLDYQIPGLKQKVITLNFHPAHAHGTTFEKEGSIGQFKRILGIIRERKLDVRTLASVYSQLENTESDVG